MIEQDRPLVVAKSLTSGCGGSRRPDGRLGVSGRVVTAPITASNRFVEAQCNAGRIPPDQLASVSLDLKDAIEAGKKPSPYAPQRPGA